MGRWAGHACGMRSQTAAGRSLRGGLRVARIAGTHADVGYAGARLGACARMVRRGVSRVVARRTGARPAARGRTDRRRTGVAARGVLAGAGGDAVRRSAARFARGAVGGVRAGSSRGELALAAGPFAACCPVAHRPPAPRRRGRCCRAVRSRAPRGSGAGRRPVGRHAGDGAPGDAGRHIGHDRGPRTRGAAERVVAVGRGACRLPRRTGGGGPAVRAARVRPRRGAAVARPRRARGAGGALPYVAEAVAESRHLVAGPATRSCCPTTARPYAPGSGGPAHRLRRTRQPGNAKDLR